MSDEAKVPFRAMALPFFFWLGFTIFWMCAPAIGILISDSLVWNIVWWVVWVGWMLCVISNATHSHINVGVFLTSIVWVAFMELSLHGWGWNLAVGAWTAICLGGSYREFLSMMGAEKPGL